MTCSQCVYWLPNRTEFKLPNVPWCIHPRNNCQTVAALSCEYFVPGDSPIVNVPNHTPKGIQMASNSNRVDGPVEIMIVSYAAATMRVSGKVVSDLDWLVYAVRSIKKFCTGFQGVTIVHPNHEREQFERALIPIGCPNLSLFGFDEIPGKGFIQHEIMLARADECVPRGTRYALLTDSDYVFRMPTTPEDYWCLDKPYYLTRPWESLITEDPRNPNSKSVSDCMMWREPTDAQIGFASPFYGMCMNCAAFPLEFFPAYRAHIESVHGKDFDTYMLEGKNVHPASRMDWTALGPCAHKLMPDAFTWIDITKGAYPMDRRHGHWSHGGISDEIRKQMEELLK